MVNNGFCRREETAIKGHRKIAGRMGLMIFLLMVVGCGGKTEYMVKATPIEGPSPDKTFVYFMRPSSTGPADNFQIWDGDYFVGFSQVKSYLVYECAPGTHLFLGIAKNKVALKADLDAGKSYYVATKIRPGWSKSLMQFTPITRGSELWGRVEEYKKSLNCVAAREPERTEWKAAQREKALDVIHFFTYGVGKANVSKLDKEDGR